MVELEGNNLYSVLVFNKKDELIDSICDCYFSSSIKKRCNETFTKRI